MAVKKKEHENLSDANIKRVMELLKATPAITKKQACEILNISYNVKRLESIIEGYKRQKEVAAKNRAAKRGTSATDEEVKEIIQSYLKGEPVSTIANSLFRPTKFVNDIINTIGIPRKLTGDEDRRKAVLPEQCVSDTFAIGEVAWSVKYNSGCIIEAELPNSIYEKKYGSKCYRIYVMKSLDEMVPGYNSNLGGFNAFVPASDLGSLQHLLKYVPSLNRILAS